MEHLKLLKGCIKESEKIAFSLWFKRFELSEVPIWDRTRLGVVTAAIVSQDDKEIDEDAIVDLAIAEVAERDSFIIDPLLSIELNGIVKQIRNADASDHRIRCLWN